MLTEANVSRKLNVHRVSHINKSAAVCDSRRFYRVCDANQYEGVGLVINIM